MAHVRRVMGIVIFFAPSLGLLDLLWHWHAEQFPFQVMMSNHDKYSVCFQSISTKNYFQVRLDHAKRLNATLLLDEKIELYNMTEDVLWRDLDRYIPEGLKYCFSLQSSLLMTKYL